MLIRFSVLPAALLLVLGGLGPAAQAQAPFRPLREEALLKQGLDQYRNGSYRAASQSLERSGASGVTAESMLLPEDDRRPAYWLLAELAEGTDTTIVAKAAHKAQRGTFPTAYRQRLADALSRYYFEKGEWGPAIEWGRKTGIAHLDNDEIAAQKFRTAYAYFNQKEFEKAAPLFRAMKGVESPYQNAGYYYYGLLAYYQEQYEEAARNLTQVAAVPAYQSTVPYLLAEIEYYRGNREAALAAALKLLQTPEKNYYDTETKLLAAQSLYEGGKYREALPYFNAYYDAVEAVRRETLYEMGYSAFKTGDYSTAASRLQPLTAEADALAQSSAALLGDVYLAAGDRRSARNAFVLAAGMDYLPAIQQQSALTAAKLSYEAHLDAEALHLTNSLLAGNAEEAVRTEATTLRAALLLRSGNFKEALATLSALSAGGQQPAGAEAIRQRAAYGYGLERLSAGDEAGADSLLRIAGGTGTDARYRNAAAFWQAETAYRMGRYEEAIRYDSEYLQRGPDAIAGPEAGAGAAYLTQGYAYLELRNWAAAQRAFQSARSAGGRWVADATAREADAALMQKDFSGAQRLYQQASQTPTPESDYLLLQQATLLGLQGRLKEKGTMLERVAKGSSAYAAEARYELGLNYIAQDDYNNAIAALRPLTQTANAFSARALLRIGAAQAEAGQEAAAIKTYTEVLDQYAGNAEVSRAAADALRGIYTENGQAAAYAAIAGKYGASAFTGVDSTFFSAAEALYAGNKFSAAASGFDEYLRRYPEGSFAPKAAYYGAVSNDKSGNKERALQLYKTVATAPLSEYTAPAALRWAVLAEEKGDTTAAYEAYQTLLPAAVTAVQRQQGAASLARLAAGRQDWPAAIRWSDALLADTSAALPLRQQTELIRANAAGAQGDTATAIAGWRRAAESRTPAVAAEAKYQLALAQLAAGNRRGAETTAMEAIKISGAPEWWNVQSYFVLAEVFRQDKDYFNARATLESISKNAKAPALRSEAAARLKTLAQEESENRKTKAR